MLHNNAKKKILYFYSIKDFEADLQQWTHSRKATCNVHACTIWKKILIRMRVKKKWPLGGNCRAGIVDHVCPSCWTQLALWVEFFRRVHRLVPHRSIQHVTTWTTNKATSTSWLCGASSSTYLESYLTLATTAQLRAHPAYWKPPRVWSRGSSPEATVFQIRCSRH